MEKLSRDFIDGVKAGLYMFAWWKDGQQFVGSGNYTLDDAFRAIDSGEWDEDLKIAWLRSREEEDEAR
jgi:hypothetical protein